jgi:hypothetical protein
MVTPFSYNFNSNNSPLKVRIFAQVSNYTSRKCRHSYLSPKPSPAHITPMWFNVTCSIHSILWLFCSHGLPHVFIWRTDTFFSHMHDPCPLPRPCHFHHQHTTHVNSIGAGRGWSHMSIINTLWTDGPWGYC